MAKFLFSSQQAKENSRNIICVTCANNLTDYKTPIVISFSCLVTGIEELVALRELDLANNCLCDHRDLEPIKALHRLSKVCYVNNDNEPDNKQHQ